MQDSPLPEAAIFDAALQLPPEERAHHLDQACGDDAALRQRIEALLKACDRTSGFLDQPAAAPGSPTGSASFPVAEKPGDIIGPYKLLQQIGEGGCGVVYMAEQEKPVQRRVALKVIKLGMDTKSVIARFEAERQALAMMDHPNIAKVLEAGATDTGRPYFVMELVRGVKITDFCDHNNLPTAGRLDLFMQVCRAIQHAHQKGIIHRDIKPSNILVTLHDGVPVPKVIDFGIAKATQGRLTDKTVFTAFEQFMGTAAYASPEQAEMTSLDIDTRSDIYSLGVLLYELLTGKTPFDGEQLLRAGLDALRRTIREKEPERPSTKLSTMTGAELTITANRRQTEAPKLLSSVRGDLDWIVMKCLEKDRARRYETANGLVTDLQRHLNQEPVLACPPSKRYRFQKLIRRNTLAFAAATAVTLALLLGLAISTWLYLREREARRHAVEAQQEQARLRRHAETETSIKDQVVEMLQGIFKSATPALAQGKDTTLLKELVEQEAKRLDSGDSRQPEVEAEMRSTIGSVYFDLGLYEKSVAMHRRALAIRRSLKGNENPDHDLAESLCNLALSLVHAGNLPEAETNATEAVALVRRTPGQPHLASCLECLAGVWSAQGKYAEAEEMYRQALELLPKSGQDTADCLANLALALRDQQKYPDAEKMHKQALELLQKTLPPDHPTIAVTLNNLAAVVLDQGRASEAEGVAQKALDMFRRLGAEKHPDFATCLNTLGKALVDQGKSEEAEMTFRDALRIMQATLPLKHPSIATELNNVAFALYQQGKPSNAVPVFQQALEMQLELLDEDHPSVALSQRNLGEMFRKLDRLAEAEPMLREALRKYRKQVGDEDPVVAMLQGSLADVLMRQNKYDDAMKLCNEMLPAGLESRPERIRLLLTRINLQARHGRWKEAARDAAKAVAVEPGNPRYGHLLTVLLLADGDREGARQSCQRTLDRFAQTNGPDASVGMAMYCLLIPPSGLNNEAAGKLADSALTLNPTHVSYQFCKGLAEYRLGRFDAALNLMAQPLASPGESYDDRFHVEAGMVKAMAHWQLKQAKEARAAFATGSEIAQTKLPQLDSPDLGSDWRDWLVAQTLMREARALIEGTTEPGIETK